MPKRLWVTLLVVSGFPASSGRAQLAQGDTVTVLSGTLRLKGLLWRPGSETPLPAVLFHHGGGCGDVSEAPRRLGPRFAARGYAFLWLYRRGAGASRDQGECAFRQIPRVRAEQGEAAAVRTRLTQALAGITAPLYLGYAADDNAEPGQSLGAELTRLGKAHQLMIYPSGGHNFVFRADHPSDADIFRFLAAHLPR
jgi:dienelactone hydrolase